jgi:hypothetical protein
MTATKNQFHVCTSTSCINVQIRGRWMIYIPDRYYIQISHQVLQFGLQGESSYHKIILIKHDPITGLSGVPYKFAVTTDHKKNWVTNFFGGETREVNVHTHDDGKRCKWGEIHPQQEQDERKIRDNLFIIIPVPVLEMQQPVCDAACHAI